jgi:hypothetical protein
LCGESKEAFESLHFLGIEAAVEEPGDVSVVGIVVEVSVCPGFEHQGGRASEARSC